uniref:Mediator of RNA polymerase II transcription subunit 5 n=1 Tax=Moniliophthora roreri TaxID=221103 RepID=A0A0W0G2M6_MONRR
MFSQFRHAVENFTPQPRKSVDEDPASGEDRSTSPGQLAENAFINLRKSFASQRSASPTPKASTRPQKSTLEERLRAVAFTIGDASNGTTPDPSARASPAPSRTEVRDHPLSPTSTPLPESRPTSPPVEINVSGILSVDSFATVGQKETAPLPTLLVEHDSNAGITGGTSAASPDPLAVASIDHSPTDGKSATVEPTSTTAESESQSITEADVAPEVNTPPFADITPPSVLTRLDAALDSAVEGPITANSESPPEKILSPQGDSPTVEELQERLQLVERRFAGIDIQDVSTSFKRLQAEKLVADAIFRELTPLETTKDSDALRDYLQNMKLKIEISQEEVNCLNGKLTSQEDRIEELRDTHRLESRSQSEQIESLRKQLAETESLLKASQGTLSQGEDRAATQKAEIDRLQKEVDKAKDMAKEEEEKRVKAISLLKTVRQKLVKAEKDKEDVVKELTGLREQEMAVRSKEEAEKVKLQSDIESAVADKEKTVNTLKAQYEKEHSLAKERHERGISALRSQFELETVTIKSTHGKELSQKDLQITDLQSKLQALSHDKSTLFDQLQQRQAEMEGLQTEVVSLKNESVELLHQLRASEDQVALLREELVESRREQDRHSREGLGNSEEAARILSALEVKHEAKVSGLERVISNLEKERTESESEWSRKVREKNNEVENLKAQLGSATRLKQQDDGVVDNLKAEIERLEQVILSKESLHTQNSALTEKLREMENFSNARAAELDAKVRLLEAQIDEGKTRETQLRSSNKTLREELRKVQSSVALLDRQRNPGVGYWTSKDSSAMDSRVSISSASSDGPSQDVRSPRAENSAPVNNDEEVNLEYIRNVILQFLEHKDMRSGVSASSWVGLCKLFLEEDVTVQSQETIESEISNSVLLLFRSYPGDPDLHGYLKYAVQNKMVSLAVFVATLLQAARSSKLHNAATLDMLCRIALDAHYASGLPAIGSLVAAEDSLMDILSIVQDALALLRTAHSVRMTHFHQLTTSASELVVALLTCIPDLSQLPTGQAMVHFADVNDLLQNFRLTPELRQLLETFFFSLSLVIGDEAKSTREAQMIQTVPMVRGKGELVGMGSNTDIVTLSLILNHIVTFRGCESGAGDGDYPVALILGTFRWTSWTPVVFYTQLVLRLIWKAFMVGRLPRLLVSFQKHVNTESNADTDWKIALQGALSNLLRRNDLLTSCHKVLSEMEGTEGQRPLTCSFIHQLLSYGLVDQRIAVGLDSGISNYSVPSLQSEAEDSGQTPESFIEWKINRDTEETEQWLEKLWRNPGSHALFTELLLKKLSTCISQLDLESLSQCCKVLHLSNHAVDILALHTNIANLVSQLLGFLEEYNCETVGDPQSAISLLGMIVLFLQSNVTRFNLQQSTFIVKNRTLSCEYLLPNLSQAVAYDKVSPEDATAFNAWFKTLFDNSSEGIDDTILRCTNPKTLLRISPALLLHAIKMTSEGKIESDILNNGVMYFIDPVLNWTLVNAIKYLTLEIQQRVLNAPMHLEVLQTIVTSASCPRPVLLLCGPYVLSLVAQRKKENLLSATFDNEEVQQVIGEILGPKQAGHINALLQTSRSWQDQPRQAIQDALTLARTGKGPFIDIEHCLKVASPSRFLQLLWSQLVISAGLGGPIEGIKRLAIHVLTMPQPGPPLLPIFINTVLPSLITFIDGQQSSEQTTQADLLYSIVSSLFTAAVSMEVAMRTVMGHQAPALGQHSSVLARRLVTDLCSRKFSYTSTILSQRLSASPPCVANFPIFMELSV